MFTAGPHLAARRRLGRRVTWALGLSTSLTALPVLLVLLVLAVKGAPALSLDFVLDDPRDGMRAGGIFPALVGTLWLVLVSLLVSCPIGVIAAVYLHEYAAESRGKRAVEWAITSLAGVPSIVHALFGLGAFVIFLDLGTSILAAGLTLAIMNLPIVITSTIASLESVPRAFREACWSLGASRWQTVRSVVLPNALPGILTGVVFSISRAAGETAPIMFTGAAFYLPFLPSSIFDQCMALAMHLFTISTQVVGVPEAVPYATALVLVVAVLLANGAAVLVRIRARARRRW